MSALVIPRPRLLQITCVAAKRIESAQPFSRHVDEEDEKQVAKPFYSIPGPPSLPIIGNLWWYARGIYRLDEPYELYSSFFKKYGHLVKENLFLGKSLLHVFSTEDIKKIYDTELGGFPLRSSHKALQKHREARKELYAHVGVAPSNAEHWHKYRNLMGMHSKLYTGYAKEGAFEKIAEELVDYLKSNLDHNGEIPLLPTFYYFTLECMGVLALGIRMGCFDQNRREDVSRFIEAVHETHYSVHKTELQPYILARQAYKNLDRAQEYIAGFVLKHMNQIKERLEISSIKNIDPFDEKRDKDLVIDQDDEYLVQTSNSMVFSYLKRGLSKRMILPMASDFFQGGIHSTAHTLTFALYNLALNPKEQEIIREQMDDPQDYYLQLVIKEVLRVNPPAIGTGRVLPTNLILSGYHVPKGTKVILHQEIAAKLEENFPEPERFMPTRFKSLKRHQTIAYKPFINGSARQCLGTDIAEKELKIALKAILKRFRVSYHYDRIKIKNYLLNEPAGPVKMRFKEI